MSPNSRHRGFIPIEQHDAFLQELAERLACVTIGDGSVSRAAVAAMRAIKQPGRRAAETAAELRVAHVLGAVGRPQPGV
jgi:hypothetical protein